MPISFIPFDFDLGILVCCVRTRYTSIPLGKCLHFDFQCDWILKRHSKDDRTLGSLIELNARIQARSNECHWSVGHAATTAQGTVNVYIFSHFLEDYPWIFLDILWHFMDFISLRIFIWKEIEFSDFICFVELEGDFCFFADFIAYRG